MAKMNGCNADMPKGPVGSRSTRINPNSFARNNLSKGGVNDQMGGTKDKMTCKVAAGGVSQGKHTHMPKGY
jgi:hypothetical protein